MKKRKFLITALCAVSVLALAACGETPEIPEIPETPAAHSHVWGAWTVADANKPTEAASGKATRTCTGEGECDATAADKEYALPALTSGDYTHTDDTATCVSEGTITYTYNKSGVNVSFTVATPKIPAAHSHVWGAWTVADANKPTEAASGKATRTCTGEGECDATAADKEYALPALTSGDYTHTDDTATCSAAGVVTYTYHKNDVNVTFTVATAVNPDAHKYGDYIVEDGNHYRVCEWNVAHIDSEAAHDMDGANGACSVCGAEKITYTVTAKCGGNAVAGLKFIVKDGAGETLENATSDSEGKITYTGWEQSVAVYFDKEAEKFSKYRGAEKIECTEAENEKTYTLTEKESATVTVENAEGGVTVYLCLASGVLTEEAKGVTDEHGVAKIYYNASDFTGDYFYVMLDYDKDQYNWTTSSVQGVYDDRGYQRFSTSGGFDDIQITGFKKKEADEVDLVTSPTSSDISTISVGETIVSGSGYYGYVKFVGAGTYKIVVENVTSSFTYIDKLLYNDTSATDNNCVLINNGAINTNFAGSTEDVISDIKYTNISMDVAIEITITLEEEDYILIQVCNMQAKSKITITKQ